MITLKPHSSNAVRSMKDKLQGRKPRLSDVFTCTAEYVLSSKSSSAYSCYALDGVSEALGIGSVNGKSPARRYFENMLDVKKLQEEEYYKRYGIFGTPAVQQNQESRALALLLAAEYARSEGF